jgi:phage virion morphogenesis protein
MSGVGLELRGKPEVSAALARAVRQAENPRGLYDNIGASLVTSTRRRFEQGVAPDGSPWPPSMRALAEGGKTLIDRARLMGSITHEADDGGVSVGSNVVYAAIHQLGGAIQQGAREQVLHFKHNARTGRTRFAKANSKANFAKKVEVGPRTINMPARPFLGIDDDDDREIELLAKEWLLGPRGANSAD